MSKDKKKPRKTAQKYQSAKRKLGQFLIKALTDEKEK